MGESLREQLSDAFDTVENSSIEGDGVDVAADATIPVPEPERAEPAPSKIVEAPRADDRPRNADGTFAEKPPEPKAAARAGATPTPPPPLSAEVAPLAAAAPQRPSSWKKDHWQAWDKIAAENPQLAAYLNERETQFARGVSTYKAEADNARPLIDAMAPFMPLLEHHRIDPGQWIHNLGTAHQHLATGSAQQKLQMFARLAQDYGVPVQALVDPEAQAQYLQQSPQPQQQPALTREDAMQLFREQFTQTASEQEVTRFGSDAAKHPHFEEVRDTMSGLLQANLAEDLESAYEAALHHPRHANLLAATQEQSRAADEATRRAEEQRRVLQARGKAVSVRSATPSGPAEEKPTGLRSQLESSFDSIAGGGRV